MAYVNLHTDGFAESGGLAALHSRGGDTATTFSDLGLRGSARGWTCMSHRALF
ncbi:autotransporter domain-containing protein [Achromobacter sp.]|uniref:autotransporter domain-containing protein n=1 Tax=Achromobacter sp. TaxID=134375 RepID=UPI00390CB44E